MINDIELKVALFAPFVASRTQEPRKTLLPNPSMCARERDNYGANNFPRHFDDINQKDLLYPLMRPKQEQEKLVLVESAMNKKERGASKKHSHSRRGNVGAAQSVPAIFELVRSLWFPPVNSADKENR